MTKKNPKTLKVKPRLLDFFCGAGGWSEGFRQQGFDVVMGIDNWRPAVETHNLNHGLEDEPMNILDFEDCPVNHIEEVFPDTEIIVGSPPCVSFSMSNKAGKADKSLGIRLIESYLRIVAAKKHKKGSVLKAWYMENVPNSRNFVKDNYSFEDLNLGDWAEEIGKDRNDNALWVAENGDILCAADYGSPQSRDRFVCGEWMATERFLAPEKTHEHTRISLREIKDKMPKPNLKSNKGEWSDPNFPHLKKKAEDITDHFYDTGVYEIEWEASRAAKVNHPFMGKMSFPENLDRPSRTIMATRSSATRESILYKSEYKREGDGQYRMPTIREAASLMGFPFTYQFTGSEGTKWKQIGNAVCPHMSIAVAKELRKKMGLSVIQDSKVKFPEVEDETFEEGELENKILDLNTFSEKTFDKPPKRKESSKFRRQPFKFGGLGVALMNHLPDNEVRGRVLDRWHAFVFVGSGKDFRSVLLKDRDLETVSVLLESHNLGKLFMKAFGKEFSTRTPDGNTLMKMYMEHKNVGKFLKPTELVERIGESIKVMIPEDVLIPTPSFKKKFGKSEIPLRHLCAMHAIGEVCYWSKSKTREKKKTLA